MLRQLSSSDDNGQSMVIYHISIKTCPASCLRLIKQSEHGNISYIYKNMPCKLSSPHDNGQSMAMLKESSNTYSKQFTTKS